MSDFQRTEVTEARANVNPTIQRRDRNKNEKHVDFERTRQSDLIEMVHADSLMDRPQNTRFEIRPRRASQDYERSEDAESILKHLSRRSSQFKDAQRVTQNRRSPLKSMSPRNAAMMTNGPLDQFLREHSSHQQDLNDDFENLARKTNGRSRDRNGD